MTRALSLSGGGARGSFQLGALGALYDVYGFRPDVIAGTSVGSVNGVMLAQGAPPAVNDPATILANAAAGGPDPQLTALRRLEAEWDTFTSTSAFFLLRAAFQGTMVADIAAKMNAAPEGEPPMTETIGAKLDQGIWGASIPIVNLVTGPIVGAELQKLKATAFAILTENAVFNLDPVSTRLNDPTKLTLAALAAGTPLYMATVSLESGRLRYIDGMGRFTERDGVTPVLSALMDSDIDAALDENLQPLAMTRKDRIKQLNARYRAAVAVIAQGRATYAQGSTTTAQRIAIQRDIGRAVERGNYLLEALRTQTRGLRITANVDPRRGVLASAALPALFDPIVIGAERYIDGGLREIIPLEIVVRSGVTDIVGICCSALDLPETDELTNAGLPTVALRALTQIALSELTFGDIEAARARGIAVTVISPTFDVHGGTEVNPSLIEISADYGWMRACDELQPSDPASRKDLRFFSDLLTTMRLRSYALERYLGELNGFYRASEARDPFVTLRTIRWIIRELLATRSVRGLPTHPQATRWWTGWAREIRPTGPFGTVSIWSQQSVFSSNGVEIRVADGVTDPAQWAPDAGSLVDAANDRVYWIVRGAVFEATAETEQTTTRTPVLVVPHGTVIGLPRIPRGSHVMAEQDTPTETWIVRNGKRYRASPALITASGLGGQAVAIVPPDGLNQIPDGGAPYWLGGLYVSDNARTPLDRWEPTPQVEGSSSPTALGLTNRSARTVTVSVLAISTGQDSGGSTVFEVTNPVPFSVPAGGFLWTAVQFHPIRPGPITGTVAITCDDPDVPQLTLPLATSATPLGAHGLLQVATSIDLGAIRVGQVGGQDLALTNTGARALGITDLHVVDGTPPGQFAIPFSWPTGLAPNQADAVHVSCMPTARGPLTGTLSIDITSATDTVHPFSRHVDVALAATGQAPVVFLAGSPLPPVLGGPVRPPIGRPPRGSGLPGLLPRELRVLDFGATAPGTAVLRTFWIRNVGDLPLTVTGLDAVPQWSFGIPNAAIFPAIISPGGELAVEVNFLAPPEAGRPASGEFGIQSDDPVRPRAVLPVVGRASGPHLSFAPQELLELAGTPPTGQLVLTSDGTDPVAIRKVGLDDPDFTVAGLPALPSSLAPGSSIPLTVTYGGTVPGQHVGRIGISHDGSANVALVILRAEV